MGTAVSTSTLSITQAILTLFSVSVLEKAELAKQKIKPSMQL